MHKKNKVTVAMAMHPQALRELEEAAEVELMAWDDPRLVESMQESDALITYTPRLDAQVLRKAVKLKAIGCHSCPQEFMQLAHQLSIQVTEAAGLWAAVADFTLGLLFTAARNIPQAHRAIREGQWQDSQSLKVQYSGRDVSGKTIGIIGLGRIGALVARRLRGFEARLLYTDPVRKAELEEKLGIGYCSLDDLLSQSDHIILLAPLNDQTRGMLGEEQFQMMKTGAVLVNTARGALVDEEALYRALASGRLAGAGLDVYAEEPIPPQHPLLTLDNVVFAPHLGGSTYDVDMEMVRGVLQAIL